MTDGKSDPAKAAGDAAAQAFAMNLQMGKAFMDAWSQALANQQRQGAAPAGFGPWPWTPPQPQPAAPGMGAAQEVSRIWLGAVSEAMRRTQDAMAKGEALTPDAYMDVWTKAASELSQAIVSDAAFASLTGHWVNQVSHAKKEGKKAAADTLRELGFATHSDVDEVGKRLVELERRVHDLTVLLEDQAKGAKPSKKKD